MDPSSTDERCVRVSAPGKVLITGGYLVLDEQHAGLVLATSARFHTTITTKPEKASSGDSLALAVVDSHCSGGDRDFSLCVESPQFEQLITARVVQSEGRYVLKLSATSHRNPYIEETLLCALNGIAGISSDAFTHVSALLRQRQLALCIRLEADNAFYSQAKRLRDAGKSLCRHSLRDLPDYLPPLHEEKDGGKKLIAKTGLGSSAALVTSLVGALVTIFLTEDVNFVEETKRLNVIHHLAQLSHCFVQRKIGSGFDVSTACFGSQRYTRFPSNILDAFTAPHSLVPNAIAACVQGDVNWRVNDRVQPFRVPANFHILMGDVSTGSTTVSMVRKVLQWQKASPEASTRVISELALQNAAVERGLFALNDWDQTDLATKCHQMAHRVSTEWAKVDETLGTKLLAIRSAYQLVRAAFREMGELANVPIEPKQQTRLLDATMDIPGVLMAGVPGAGGDDAVFVLVLDEFVVDRVEALWIEWSTLHLDTTICPLLCDVSRPSNAALWVHDSASSSVIG